MWADYLLSHAHRLYSVATNQYIQNARVLLKRKDKLPNPFSVRDIHRKNWAGLDNVSVIMESLEFLIDYRHIRSKKILSTTQGGRPTIVYHWVVNLKKTIHQKFEDVPDCLVTELT
ncbi:MAG: hypothetical protein H0U75_11115 [Legionella sp.]|nr:hypothetical protein [Legionella sp.]